MKVAGFVLLNAVAVVASLMALAWADDAGHWLISLIPHVSVAVR